MEKYYYKIKPEIYNYIKKNKKTNKELMNRKVAKKIKKTEPYISGILNGKKTNISFTTAKCYAEALNPEWKIEDVFDIVERN